MDRLKGTIKLFNELGNKMIINQKHDITCKNCVDYMNCLMNQIGIGSGKFAEECNFYKFNNK